MLGPRLQNIYNILFYGYLALSKDYIIHLLMGHFYSKKYIHTLM